MIKYFAHVFFLSVAESIIFVMFWLFLEESNKTHILFAWQTNFFYMSMGHVWPEGGWKGSTGQNQIIFLKNYFFKVLSF